ncbi:polysaccharide biosynthesis C-terminal domain-containing protein [Bradyrhizobium sp. CB3481]|uniref:oligosaccharide flippase family protein n=1 Tax=Bradyrhizobium sp. CB3481 TaxID=3039158 RepID=UPI0024B09568|nr:polysaccharide biosynthesis C-terminal domain-containing protein [Bradyrhizobium sp. CB3481]WFU18473.1 polysaccharide biosynthesis C-terminal domain-containing protein [Bradyrhizobium sp. CB3481]
MIIEAFGPPGAGKTTFSRALAERLRQRGYSVDLILFPRLESEFLSRAGFVPALLRATSAIFVAIVILCRPTSNAPGLRLARDLLRLMPPASPAWWIRISQYVVRFSCAWNDPHKPDRIVLFDQGFVQAVCSLALHSRADQRTIAQAMCMRRQPDLLIRFDAPKELLEQRLRQRSGRKSFVEKWLDRDVRTFLKMKPITDYVGSLLATQDKRMISVNSLDPKLLRDALDLVEQEISARFGKPPAIGLQSAPEPGQVDRAIDRPARACSGTGISIAAGSETDLTDRLARASLWSFAVYVGGAGLTGLAQLVIARTVGPASYGIYSYVLAWTTLLSYVATLGFSMVLLRFVPAYSVKGQWSLARGVIRFAFKRSFLVAVAIAISGVVIVLPLERSFGREMTVSLAIGLAIVPLVALYVLGGATVRAFGGVISATAPERLVRDGLMLAIVLLAAAFSVTSPDATTVLSALLISSVATAGLLLWSALKLWPPQLRSAELAYAPRDWWHLAFPVMIMTGVDVILNRAGLIVLVWSGDTHAAGIFALGLNLALLLILPRMAVGTFFAPNVSRLHASLDGGALQSLFARATVLTVAGTITLALPLLLLTEPLLQFFGEDFVAAVPITQVLVVGQIVAAAMGPQQSLLTMTGRERVAATLMVIGAIINVLGCALGIAIYGAMGAAVATAVTNIVWNGAMTIYISRRVNMSAGLPFAIAEFWSNRTR